MPGPDASRDDDRRAAATVVEGPWGSATISGTVSLPAGAKMRKLGVSVLEYDGCFDGPCCCSGSEYADVEASGEFVVRGLRPERRYLVELHDSRRRVVEGYYAGDGQPLTWSEGGADLVVAPRNDLLLAPAAAVSITGSVELPIGVRRKDVSLTVEHVVGLEVSVARYEDLRKDGTFVVRGLDPGATYRVQLTGDGKRSFEGYYTGTGSLTSTADDALLVTGPTEITVRAVDIASLPR